MGWASATGEVGIESLTLFLIIFLWTPPHFWALALFKVGDYAKAGIPMMPNVAGEDSTRRQILAYALLLAPVAVLPWPLGFASPYYGAAAAALGAAFVWRAWKVLGAARDGQEAGDYAVRLLDPLSVRDLRRSAGRCDRHALGRPRGGLSPPRAVAPVSRLRHGFGSALR